MSLAGIAGLGFGAPTERRSVEVRVLFAAAPQGGGVAHLDVRVDGTAALQGGVPTRTSISTSSPGGAPDNPPVEWHREEYRGALHLPRPLRHLGVRPLVPRTREVMRRAP